MKTLTGTLLFTVTTLLTLTTAIPTSTNPPPPICGTCNPLSGSNNCDATTSCINTGANFHCACRAGYKASTTNTNGYDDVDHPNQFRLKMPHYEFLVFVPENTACATLCEDPFAGPAEVCKEVPVFEGCVV